MNRTQVICIHEGKHNSIDRIFANAFIRKLNPSWLRPTETVYFVECGSRSNVISRFPIELKNCAKMGSNATLVVLADVDDDCKDADELKRKFWEFAKNADISIEMFEKAIFIFPKDRIENWIQFLSTGETDENKEAPRVTGIEAKRAARKLAEMHESNKKPANLPPSLKWSCINWKKLTARMS